MLVGYARTSTSDQDAGLEGQISDLVAAGCERVFQEQVSSLSQRGELNHAIDFVRGGDTLVITKIDRLARSVVHLWEIVGRLEAKGVALRILNFAGDSIDTKGAAGRLTLSMFAAFAEFERAIMLDRQKVGIAKAKAQGRYKGRKPTARAKTPEVVRLYGAGKKVAEIARELGIGRASVYRAIRSKGTST